MRREEKIPTIIDGLYAGTLDDSAWQRAFVSIVDLVSGSGAMLFGFSPATGEILRDETFRFDAGVVAEYRRDWVQKDERIRLSAAEPIGTPIFESRLLPHRKWRRTEIYNDFLVRIDAPSCLAVWLHRAWDRTVALTIEGSMRRAAFDERDGRLLKPLLPHIRRALQIRDRLEASRVRADTLATALDTVTFGVMVLDAAGRVLEANAVAQKLLGDGSSVRRNPDGTLWLRGAAGKELDEWLSKGVPPSRKAEGLLRVPRALLHPLSVLVTRLAESHTAWIGSGSPAWCLLLFDPERSLNASIELTARDLGISDREAELATLLVAGDDLKKIAARLHISVHTARTHLKAIYSKTGVRSQAELIRRIANGPAAVELSKIKRGAVPQERPS